MVQWFIEVCRHQFWKNEWRKKISSIVVSSHRALKSFRGGLFLDLLILFLLFCKDQLFWEGHKNLLNLPHGLNVCLVNFQTMRKIVQIFDAFSEKLNFNNPLISTESTQNRRNFVFSSESSTWFTNKVSTFCFEVSETVTRIIVWHCWKCLLNPAV